MEVPKMKILIYALTFAAYAWSGYGSTVLGTLKDAVLSAENVFGDLLGKVNDVFHAIKNVKDTIDVTVEEECSWSCPDGVKAKQNKYYKATGNGCGPEGLQVDTNHMPSVEMTKCCNEHDICYGTCNKLKDVCDFEFRRCLYKICESMKKEDVMLTGCKAAAKLLHSTAANLGCKFYRDAQQEACFCAIPKRKYYEL
ncbi:hypothetical protein AAG570_002547 [Ranatra chinensis]|uniref:Group XIIA secretory phospholipase A2 n=1 Tax=Ranatra chinensis TaxID=642074 RepID=A0ABD0Y897_9HEMI